MTFTFAKYRTLHACFFLSLQELFIQALARFSLEQSPDSSSLEYRDLAEIVNTETTLQFLQGMFNRKPMHANQQLSVDNCQLGGRLVLSCLWRHLSIKQLLLRPAFLLCVFSVTFHFFNIVFKISNHSSSITAVHQGLYAQGWSKPILWRVHVVF